MTAYLDYAGIGIVRPAARTAMHAVIDEVALVPNASTGLHLVADGLDWRPGDEIVVFDHDFPAKRPSLQRLSTAMDLPA